MTPPPRPGGTEKNVDAARPTFGRAHGALLLSPRQRIVSPFERAGDEHRAVAEDVDFDAVRHQPSLIRHVRPSFASAQSRVG